MSRTTTGRVAAIAADPAAPEPIDGSRRTLPARMLASLRRASESPTSLWLALLAVNALFLPYRSRFHDAILYGFQIQNAAEHGRFQDDLFLRFGSQDGYSIFSAAAAPLVRWVGLQNGMFLLYLLSTALFLLAAVRLIGRLIPDRLEAAAGLLFLAVSQPIVGSLAIRVNEDFLTARLPAEALVLFGLERLLAGHPVVGTMLQVAALSVHPLMAFGGLLVTLVWCGLRYLPRRYIVPLAAGGASLGLLALVLGRAAGVRLLAPVDGFWLAQVEQESPYMFVDEWLARDWITLSVAVLVAAYARRRMLPGSAASHLLFAVLTVTALAVAGSIVVRCSPFALILQGQPFRSLWVLQAVALPLAVPVACHLWSRGDGPWRAAAVLLIWCLGRGLFPSPMLGLSLVFPLAALAIRGTAPRPRDPGWLWRSLALSLFAGLVLDMALEIDTHLRMRPIFAGMMDPSTFRRMPLAVIPPALRVVPAAVVVGLIGLLARSPAIFRLAALALFLTGQIIWFRLDAPGPSETRARADGAAVRFLQGYLSPRLASGGPPPTVYWPTGHVDLLWHDLRVNSYYDWYQLAGNVFRRETAVEGRRRGELVRAFEVDLGRRRRLLETLSRPSHAERTFGVGLKDPPPRLGDLIRLCADPGVDFAVLRQGFPGWYDAHEGNWFVYDARAIRARTRADAPGDGTAKKPPGEAPPPATVPPEEVAPDHRRGDSAPRQASVT